MKVSDEEKLLRMWEKATPWKVRKESTEFLISQLRKNQCKNVYDLCLGGGIEAVALALNGFNVFGNEIDPRYTKIADDKAKKQGIDLILTAYDWRELPSTPKFDSAIMWGNSLIYLEKEKDRRIALNKVYSLLNEKGLFIIDHRNFDYILKEREDALRDKFRYSGKHLYEIDRVNVYPIEVTDNSVLFEYFDRETGEKDYISHYPLKEEETKRLLIETGFRKVETFYDFQQEKPEHYDFVQHVAHK